MASKQKAKRAAKLAKVATQKRQNQAAKRMQREAQRAAIEAQNRARQAAAEAAAKEQAEWEQFQKDFAAFEKRVNAKNARNDYYKNKPIGYTVAQDRINRKLQENRRKRQIATEKKRSKYKSDIDNILSGLAKDLEHLQDDYGYSNKYLHNYNELDQLWHSGEEIDDIDELESMLDELKGIDKKVHDPNFEDKLKTQDKKIEKQFGISASEVKDYRNAISAFYRTLEENNIDPSEAEEAKANLDQAIENGWDPAKVEEFASDINSIIFTGQVLPNMNEDGTMQDEEEFTY